MKPLVSREVAGLSLVITTFSLVVIAGELALFAQVGFPPHMPPTGDMPRPMEGAAQGETMRGSAPDSEMRLKLEERIREEMKRMEERRAEERKKMDERREEEMKHRDEMNPSSRAMTNGENGETPEMRNAAPIQDRSLYRSARWTCYDGTEYEKEGSCSYSWPGIAQQFCTGKCGENGKCGVNSFTIGEPCDSDNSRCGNGHCEPGEGPACPQDCVMPLENTCGNNKCEDGEANQIIGNGGYSAEGMRLGEPLEMKPGSCPSDCPRPQGGASNGVRETPGNMPLPEKRQESQGNMHFCYKADGTITTDPSLCDQTTMQKKFEEKPRIENAEPPREQPYCFDKDGAKTSDPSRCDIGAMQRMFGKEQGERNPMEDGRMEEEWQQGPEGSDMPRMEASRINIAGIAGKALMHINGLLQRVPEESKSHAKLESLLQYVGGLIATYGGKTLSPEDTERVTRELRGNIESVIQTMQEEGVTMHPEGMDRGEQIGTALERLNIVIRTVLPKVFLFLADKHVAGFDLSGALEIAGTVASSHDTASKVCTDTTAADCKPALNEVFSGMKKLENLMRGPIEESGLMEEVETFFREAMPQEEWNAPEDHPEESTGPYLQ